MAHRLTRGGAAMGEQCLLLGVDGGGTHTRAILAEAGGGVVGLGTAGASNQATGGAAAAGAQLAAAITAALGGRSPLALAGACLGLAGLDRPLDLEAYRSELARIGLPSATHLVNDSEIAWAGATGGAPGIAIGAGTGSVAYGRNTHGLGARCGGWGLPFGDEGGAGWIGAEAIRRVLRGCDGRQEPTPLAQALCAAAGCRQPEDLCRLPAGMTGEAALGRLAPVVTTAAAAGDAAARRIVAAAADALVELACALAARLGLARPAIHGLGSVLVAGSGPAQTPVAVALHAGLRQRLGVPLLPARHTALVGALILAHERTCGTLPAESVIARWEGTLC